MLIEPREYHCPQCGYDLRGQTVNRCPECGFLYDLPALRELSLDAFYSAIAPYIRASKVLAPAAILGLGVLCVPSYPAHVSPFMCIAVPLGIVLLISPRLVEGWVIGSLEREAHRLDWLNSILLGGWLGVILFLRLVLLLPGLARFLILGTILAGVVWAVHGLLSTEANSLLSATKQQNAIFERARFATWTLVAIDCFVLILVCVS